ncbi:hypothetical protein FAZ15_17320 [Sphingobacterium olei]|uniref:Uncharacterized protein n=1 Tax=Sphingobacterium olei TaxID=2571155 RepID=A0A4U0NHT8_9SPHI|nr:hypothetical protein [Sphingobacterium olei]TJZ53785.1 hypothetical protein FAZ15_17320 [Sphingobacterium olei]
MQTKLKFKIIRIKAMPQIEVEKMLNVLLLRRKKRYSQFELSFLMGQHDFYVRDAEDLAHTLVYTVPFANIFREIFDCDIQAIVPDVNQKPIYSIRILEATDQAGNTIYRAERQLEDGTVEFIAMFGTEEKDLQLEFAEPKDIVSELEVKDWVLGKIESGYFDVAKNALEIFDDCKFELKGLVRPLFLAKALKSCNGTKGLPKLNKKKDGNARFVYGKGN